MFDGHNTATELALLIYRLVPEDEITFRILAATVEDAASFGLAPDERTLAAFGTGNAQIIDNGLGIMTFGKIGTGQEFAKPSEFIDHRRTAEFTHFSRILSGYGDFFHALFGRFHFRLKDIIKFFQDVDIGVLPLFDGIQFFFHMSREADVDDAFKELFQEIDDNDTQLGRNELLILLFDIIAVLDGIHNRCICTRTADAFFFQGLNQAGFGIAGRRLGKMLERIDSLVVDDRAGFNRRKYGKSLIFFRIFIQFRKPFEQHSIPGGSQFVGAAHDDDGHMFRFHRSHLAGQETVPDERVQAQLIP